MAYISKRDPSLVEEIYSALVQSAESSDKPKYTIAIDKLIELRKFKAYK